MKRINTNALESVVYQFEHWRSTRKKRERIPEALWTLVAPLMNQYGYNKLALALRVNHSQLKKHVLPLLPHKQEQSATFVECLLPVPRPSAGNCVMEFTFKNSSVIKISGLLPLEMLPIISLLIGR